MKVFKFGGASVKDAKSIRNIASIISLYDNEKLAIVISAMGKTTNLLEKTVNCLINRKKELFEEKIEVCRQFHFSIIEELFNDRTNDVYNSVSETFVLLSSMYESSNCENYDFVYDQVVSFGEEISTKIISEFLIQEGFNARLVDAKKLIRTNKCYSEAEVNWDITTSLFQTDFLSQYDKYDFQIIQGFVGHNSEGFTTTLGREGSDFTAAIVAYCCTAQDVTIWKDVPGMLNADPKWFNNTIKLEKISFREAIELSYYGASVIHPKTIKPLQNKNIPLYVKSFKNPKADGTIIDSCILNDKLVPSFIFKMNQVLFSFTPKDFSFIVEDNLSDIFNRLSKANAKINLMQNSALQFSIVLDADKVNIQKLLLLFTDNYQVRYNTGLELVTIRHYNSETIKQLTVNKEVILQQITRETARLVIKSKHK